MQRQSSRRRAYGSGSLTVKNGAWYGRWYSGGARVKRKLGPVRPPGTREGLTKTQAEARMRGLMATETPVAVGDERLTVAEVGARYVTHARRLGRKPSTIENLESELRTHLQPFFAGRSMERISAEDVADLIALLEGKGLAPKTIKNVIATLSAMFNFASAPRRRWATQNPCVGAELPAVEESTEIRFFTVDELDRLVEHARPGPFQAIDGALYVTAAMTGLRRGELVALRWRDVDWTAARIRVRQNYVRGRYGTPKSRRSTRSVPMCDELGGALDRHFQVSGWSGDGDLVFAHPATGGPLALANITRRMQKAAAAAGLNDAHVFHDLRHTFGTSMAAAGVPMRTLQEWMGHRHLSTTQRYADYAPSEREAELVARAFARRSDRGPNLGPILSESERTQRT